MPDRTNDEETDMRTDLPEHLRPYWGNRVDDPRDKPAYCARQARKTPAIPWHNGLFKCLACKKVMRPDHPNNPHTNGGWRTGLILRVIPAGYVVATNDGHGHRENVHHLRVNGKVTR